MSKWKMLAIVLVVVLILSHWVISSGPWTVIEGAKTKLGLNS